MNTRTRKTDLFFNRWVCLFLCKKVSFHCKFQLDVEIKPTYTQDLFSVAIINLDINEFKERMGEYMAIPYDFKKVANGSVHMVASEIAVVQRMYQRYVDGASLGGIAADLVTDQIVSPSDNSKWSRSVIDKILSNGKYVPYAIPMELFVAAQFEKDSRTNTQMNSDGSPQI